MIQKIFELLTYFIVYSFFGWIMESTFRTIKERKIINTGFLIGPFCPIYGIGAIIMFLFLDRFENRPIILFFIGIIVLSIWEYIVGYLLEKIFNTKYWDYSDHKFNIKGRICLTNSIYWGILGVLFVKYIHPFMQSILAKINITLLISIISILSIGLIVDFIVSIMRIKNINIKLQTIEQLNREIKEKLEEIRQIKNSRSLAAVDSIKEIVESLKEKRNKTIIRLYRNIYRLKKAFPAIETKEITEVLNQKIQIIKQRNKIKTLRKRGK